MPAIRCKSQRRGKKCSKLLPKLNAKKCEIRQEKRWLGYMYDSTFILHCGKEAFAFFCTCSPDKKKSKNELQKNRDKYMHTYAHIHIWALLCMYVFWTSDRKPHTRLMYKMVIFLCNPHSSIASHTTATFFTARYILQVTMQALCMQRYTLKIYLSILVTLSLFYCCCFAYELFLSLRWFSRVIILSCSLSLRGISIPACKK